MLTAGEYEVGSDVLVTIRAKVGGRAQGPTGPLLELRSDDGRLVTRVWPGSPGVTVERLAPAEPEVPEWWERRGPGMSVLDNRRPWLHLADDLQFPWVAPPNLARTDAQMLELADGPLTLLYDPSDTEKAPVEITVPDDDISWPPKRAGLRYRDGEGDVCTSIDHSGQIWVTYEDYPVEAEDGYAPSVAQERYGPMKPLGEASC